MIIISDTSVISNLYQIGYLDLLKQLFGRVVISPAVLKELNRYKKHPNLPKDFDWIEIKNPLNIGLIQDLLEDLDRGEAESIVLALEQKAKFLLIDEYKGREIAKSMDVKIVGILGVLILALKKGLVVEIRSIILLLLENGFRLNHDLINSVLSDLDEKGI